MNDTVFSVRAACCSDEAVLVSIGTRKFLFANERFFEEFGIRPPTGDEVVTFDAVIRNARRYAPSKKGKKR